MLENSGFRIFDEWAVVIDNVVDDEVILEKVMYIIQVVLLSS